MKFKHLFITELIFLIIMVGVSYLVPNKIVQLNGFLGIITKITFWFMIITIILELFVSLKAFLELGKFAENPQAKAETLSNMMIPFLVDLMTISLFITAWITKFAVSFLH